MIVIKLIGLGHIAVTELHDFEDVVSVLLFYEFDVHLIIMGVGEWISV